MNTVGAQAILMKKGAGVGMVDFKRFFFLDFSETLIMKFHICFSCENIWIERYRKRYWDSYLQALAMIIHSSQFLCVSSLCPNET